MHTIRYFWYFFRLVLYSFLGIFRFVSKPGSRVIVPLTLIVLGFLLRSPLHTLIAEEARRADPGYLPESGILDAGIVIFIVVLSVAYALTSKLLAVILGAFPVAMRPMAPQRRLKQSEDKIKPVVVRVVVPPLPKQPA